MEPTPEVRALIIADQIYRDDASGKISILGIRSAIGARKWPCEHPPS